MNSTFRNALLMVGAALLTLACSSGNKAVDYNTAASSYYLIESEPAITSDRQYIFFVSIDTTSLGRDGVYRLEVSRPEREGVIKGKDFSSPSSLPRGMKVAYLDSSRIHIFRTYDSTNMLSGFPEEYSSLLYVDDSTLIAGNDSGLYRFDLRDSSVTHLVHGWDPTIMTADTIAYFRSAGLAQFEIVLQSVFDSTASVIAAVATPEIPRWASVEPRLHRFAYAEPNGAGYIIYTGEQGSNARHLIGGTRYPKTCMIDFNLLLFSGPDGRFFQSDFEGTYKFPFVYGYGDGL